jgi:hypothetical protein
MKRTTSKPVRIDPATIPNPTQAPWFEGQNLLNQKHLRLGLPRMDSVAPRSLCGRNHDSAPGHGHGEARYAAE